MGPSGHFRTTRYPYIALFLERHNSAFFIAHRHRSFVVLQSSGVLNSA